MGKGRGRCIVVQILTLIHFIIWPIIVLPFRREVSFIVVLWFYFVFFLLPRFLHLSGSPLTDCVLDGFYQDGCIKRESDVKDLLVKKYYKVIKYNNWPNYKMDQCKYLNNYAPTPPLTQQRTINDMLDIVGLKEE